ncbi:MULTISPECIES: adenosine deaminase [unclassified Brachybacterium]|uniref:adenosine deaminase n=1 Tax=unclassified Brachybacterium TaxID=2623841 RepID=UPI00360CD41F
MNAHHSIGTDPDGTARTQWLLPVNPAAHLEHQPGDWLERRDATAVWEAIARSQPVERWCLRSGFRTMQIGDLIWAYLSRRQEVCAVGVVRDVAHEEGGWFVHVDWDEARTARLCRDPVPRSSFEQVPMSTCRADAHAAEVLSQQYKNTGSAYPALMHLHADDVRSLPKVALHDHLDGGLRPETVLELCRDHDIDPPGQSAEEIAEWFRATADSGSLPAYLSTFERTLALMQTAPELRRIAREFVEDMAADGVVYAETRWAPHQHTGAGLTLDEAVQAVQDGLDEGVAAAAAGGHRIVVGQLLAYLRHLEPSDDLVEIARARRDSGVVGIDLAGPEAGFPASRFRAQFDLARRHGVRVTIHAGEADRPASIADALDCGAERIGHGVRLIEDISDDELGPTAGRIHREQVCLEVCPSSNLQTGAATDLAGHPVGPLHQHGFAVAISSDNRLMSRTSTSREMAISASTFDWSLEDLEQIVLTGLDAGFAPAEQRRELREEVVLPAFRVAREG